jgi:hypothetical protein
VEDELEEYTGAQLRGYCNDPSETLKWPKLRGYGRKRLDDGSDLEDGLIS